jgi:hypothetical protein
MQKAKYVFRLVLSVCRYDLGTTKRMKKTRQTSNEVDGRHEETSQKFIDHNREEH